MFLCPRLLFTQQFQSRLTRLTKMHIANTFLWMNPPVSFERCLLLMLSLCHQMICVPFRNQMLLIIYRSKTISSTSRLQPFFICLLLQDLTKVVAVRAISPPPQLFYHSLEL